jgi:hypothetical protein
MHAKSSLTLPPILINLSLSVSYCSRSTPDSQSFFLNTSKSQ